jgi:ABC-type Fe3+-siderophore transport system permease subunit
LGMTNELNPKLIFPRLLGALIIYRTIAPVVMIIILVFVLYYIPTELNRISSEAIKKIEDEHMAPLKSSLKDMQKEVDRLKGEVQKAKTVVEGVQGELKKVVTPIYTAISALTVALRGLRSFTQKVINSIIQAVNKVPIVNIPKVNFPEIDIDLPRLNLKPLQINLKPDLKGLKEVQRISKEVRTEVTSSAEKAGETFSTGWKWIKVIMVLFAIWLLSLCVTIFEAMWRNIFRGWKMLLGQEAKETN